MAAAALRRNPRALLRHHRPFSALSALSAQSEPDLPPPSAGAPPTSLSALRSKIRAEADPDRVASLFLSSISLPRFHADRPLFSLAIARLTRARRPDLVQALLESLLADPHVPRSEGYAVRLISLYSAAGLPEHAASAFARLPSLNIPRSDKSLSALLSAFLRNHRFAQLRETFDRAPEDFGVAPGVVSHNILLQALCENGEIDAARKLLDEMGEREGEVKPDIVSYNTVLNCYLKKGDQNGFDEILKKIATIGLEPNVVTFNCRIAHFCKKKESFKAEELLDVMLSNKVQPNLGTFNTIISGYCREGDAGAAMRVFKRMKVMKRMNGSDGVLPNADTYNSLLRSLVEKGDFCQALKISKECLARKFVPPFEVLKGLVDGLVKDSKVDEAKDIVAKMRTITKGDAVDAWNKVEGELSL